MSTETQQTRYTQRSGRKYAARLIFAALIILFTVWLFIAHQDYFTVAGAEGRSGLDMTYTLLCVGMTLVSVVLLILPERIRPSRRAGWILSLLVLFAWPICDYLISETAMATGCNFMHLSRYALVMNLWLYCLIEGVVLALTLSIPAAVCAGTVGMTIFSAANIYLMEFRQIPLYLVDLVDVKTAGDVVGSYSFGVSKGIALLILFFFMTFILVRRIWPKGQRYILKKRWIWRLVLIPVTVGMTLYTGWYMIFTSAPGKHGVSMSSYRPIKSYIKNGGMLTFVRSGKFLIVEKPAGYSVQRIETLSEQYPSDSADTQTVIPNVIAIMDEAFADLQTVGSFETNMDVMPVIHNLEENTVKGDLYVSVFGGHTANSEYEFLTGDSYDLCPSGTPYVLYVRDGMPNLTTALKVLGTQANLAMHPNVGSNYNRTNVYSSFGFDDFITSANFDEPDRVRGNISDKADFDRIIAEYEEAKATSDAPFYMFNVTMQNHSGYESNDDNLPQVIEIISEGIEDKDQAERYLNLLHLTDQRVGELISYFEQVDDPTVIVFFGDHQPGLSDEFYNSILPVSLKDMSDEEELEKYKTTFFIWANYDIEEESNVKISANYLQMKLKQVTGMPMTGYDHFLEDLYSKLPVYCAAGCIDAEGNYYKTSSTKNPYYADVEDYSCLVYNHLFDTKNWSEMFYLAS